MKFYEIKANLVLPDSDEVDKSCGYYFELPLDENMKLVEEDWKQTEQPYYVTRFWADEEVLYGELVLHMRKSWSIKYAQQISQDATVQLGEEVIQVGELLSIRDHAGAAHTFRITSVQEVSWIPTATELGV